MPFLLPALPFIAAAGSVLGGVEAGRAQGRQQESNANLQYDNLNLKAPQQRAANAVRGDILANEQPVSISGPLTGTGGRMPTITGGLTPSLLSQNTRQLGQQLSRQALLSQMDNGGNYQPPQSNGLDTLLNLGGAAGLGAGAYHAFQPNAIQGSPILKPIPGNPNLPYQPLPTGALQ